MADEKAKLSKKDERQIEQIRARNRDVLRSNATEIETNGFLRVPGEVFREQQFLLDTIDKLMGRTPQAAPDRLRDEDDEPPVLSGGEP